MNEVYTQAQLVERELESRLEQAREDDRPKVPGFGSLQALEEEHQRIQRELEDTRRSVADRQRTLESSILQLERMKEQVEVGDQLQEKFKGMIEFGIAEFIESRISKTPEAEAVLLQGLNEIPGRKEFLEHWPSVKKRIQKKVKELDAEIQKMMKEDKAA